MLQAFARKSNMERPANLTRLENQVGALRRVLGAHKEVGEVSTSQPVKKKVLRRSYGLLLERATWVI